MYSVLKHLKRSSSCASSDLFSTMKPLTALLNLLLLKTNTFLKSWYETHVLNMPCTKAIATLVHQKHSTKKKRSDHFCRELCDSAFSALFLASVGVELEKLLEKYAREGSLFGLQQETLRTHHIGRKKICVSPSSCFSSLPIFVTFLNADTEQKKNASVAVACVAQGLRVFGLF